MRKVISIVALIIGLSYWATPALDIDTPLHLIGGALIVQNHALPRLDIINAFNPFWHDYQWLYQIPFYYMYVLGGIDLQRYALALYIVAILFQCLDLGTFLLRGRNKEPALILTLLFFLVFLPQLDEMRPELVSISIILLAMKRLVQKPDKLELPYLLCLAVLLVNMQVDWIFVPLLWLCMRSLPAVICKRVASTRYAVGGLVILSLAGACSPYTFIPLLGDHSFYLVNYGLLWDSLFMPPVLAGRIIETYSAFKLGGLPSFGLLVFLALFGRYIMMRYFLIRIGEVTLACVGFGLAYRSAIFLPFFAVFSLPFVCFSAAKLQRELERLAGRGKVKTASLSLLLIVGAYHSYFMVSRVPFLHPGQELLSSLWPQSACEFIATDFAKNSEHRHSGLVATHFSTGGWCRWAIYESDPGIDIRVTTDGRTEWVPAEHFGRSFALYDVQGKWQETLELWSPDYVLTHKVMPLAAALMSQNETWEPVYSDAVYLVFRRKKGT
jgi:hypothetical protein